VSAATSSKKTTNSFVLYTPNKTMERISEKAIVTLTIFAKPPKNSITGTNKNNKNF